MIKVKAITISKYFLLISVICWVTAFFISSWALWSAGLGVWVAAITLRLFARRAQQPEARPK